MLLLIFSNLCVVWEPFGYFWPLYFFLCLTHESRVPGDVVIIEKRTDRVGSAFLKCLFSLTLFSLHVITPDAGIV